MNKKLSLILVVLINLMFPKAFAERYLPLFADKLLIQNNVARFDFFYGDSIIRERKYTKVYNVITAKSEIHQLFNGSLTHVIPSYVDSMLLKEKNKEVVMLFREDTLAGKVYVIKHLGGSNIEEEMDLKMNPFQEPFYNAATLQNVVQGTITAYGITRRAVFGNCCTDNGYQGFIEGIGVVGYDCQCGGPPVYASQLVKYIVFRDGRIEKYSIASIFDLGVENESDRKNLALVDFIINHRQLTYTLCGEHASVPAQCNIYGANGSVVYKGQIGSTPQTVSTASLSPGIYLAVVTTSAGEVLGRHKFLVK